MSAEVREAPSALTGRTAAEKIAGVQATLREAREDAAVITALDSIAWLFNIRGGDLPHTPFVLSHALVPAAGSCAPSGFAVQNTGSYGNGWPTQ